ncbi:hypothetical protein D043_2670B, partial [Vibrio parahaemolyticus EKP-021]
HRKQQPLLFQQQRCRYRRYRVGSSLLLQCELLAYLAHEVSS